MKIWRWRTALNTHEPFWSTFNCKAKFLYTVMRTICNVVPEHHVTASLASADERKLSLIAPTYSTFEDDITSSPNETNRVVRRTWHPRKPNAFTLFLSSQCVRPHISKGSYSWWRRSTLRIPLSVMWEVCKVFVRKPEPVLHLIPNNFVASLLMRNKFLTKDHSKNQWIYWKTKHPTCLLQQLASTDTCVLFVVVFIFIVLFFIIRHRLTNCPGLMYDRWIGLLRTRGKQYDTKIMSRQNSKKLPNLQAKP